MQSAKLVLACLVGTMLILVPVSASSEDLSGFISTTRVIRENSRLVGNITCTVTGAPCISFGAPRISLRLNGFTMTGQADPTNACAGVIQAGEQGISSNSQTDVEVLGPGVVQRFRADGIFFVGTLVGKVEHVTVTTNCQSGIRVGPTASRISVAGNIAVRNGATGAPCGGI